MRKSIVAILSCLLVLVLSGCEYKEEPQYTKAWSYGDYMGFRTVEEMFAAADVVVTGTVTHGNKTHVTGKEYAKDWPSVEIAYEMAYVIAEVEVDMVYKGELRAGDIIDIKQKNGEDDYVHGGYLAYKSDYILFLIDYGERYELLVPNTRAKIIDGSFERALTSSAFGEIKTTEELSEHLAEIIASPETP